MFATPTSRFSFKAYTAAFLHDVMRPLLKALEEKILAESTALSGKISTVQRTLDELLYDHSQFYEQQTRRVLLDQLVYSSRSRVVPRGYAFESSRFHKDNQCALLSKIVPDDLDFALRCRTVLEEEKTLNFQGQDVQFSQIETDCYTPNVLCKTKEGIEFLMVCAEVKYAIVNLAHLAHALLQALHVPLLVEFLLCHYQKPAAHPTTQQQPGANSSANKKELKKTEPTEASAGTEMKEGHPPSVGSGQTVASVVYRHLRIDDPTLKSLLRNAHMMCTHAPCTNHSHGEKRTTLAELIAFFIRQLEDWKLLLVLSKNGSNQSVDVEKWMKVRFPAPLAKVHEMYSLITESQLIGPGSSMKPRRLKDIHPLSDDDPRLQQERDLQAKASVARILCCLITAHALNLGHFHFQCLQSIGGD